MMNKYTGSLIRLFKATVRWIIFYIIPFPLEYHEYDEVLPLIDGYWHFRGWVIAFQDRNGKLNFTW